MSDQYDNEEGYCRMLGHFLKFEYCRTVNKGLPCYRVLDCWFEKFPVQEFIDSHYTVEQQKKIFTAPQPKLSSIADILEQAQQRLNKKND